MWLDQLRRRLGISGRKAATNRRPRPLSRLTIEGLEDRLVPAFFAVTSTADNTAAVITAGHAGTQADPFLAPSLRSAISAANATPGANTIELTVAGTYAITIPGAGEDNNATGDFDISGVICTAEELDWVRDGFSFHERLAMVFSAKEAVYKGIYPYCKQYIDFQDVELSWLPERQSFGVSVLEGTNARLPSLRGCEVHCRCLDGFVFSCMIHEPEDKRRRSADFVPRLHSKTSRH